jgi:DNA-binding PadR family transcriptional regulator
LAVKHLRSSLTRDNLWLYVLSELRDRDATPSELKARVGEKHGFAPATITFYTVLYRLRREGLVKRSSNEFRSAYSVTTKGKDELVRAMDYLEKLRSNLAGQAGS